MFNGIRPRALPIERKWTMPLSDQRWKAVAEKLSVEVDPIKVIELSEELCGLLDERAEKIKAMLSLQNPLSNGSTQD